MNPYFIIVAAFVAVFSQFASAQDDLLESVRRIGAMEKADVPFDPAEYMTISDQALHAWSAASEDDRARFSLKMFLVHFRRAGIFAAAGNFSAAAAELKEEAMMQNEFGGRLEFATKSPDSFFYELVELQALVTAETGSDPLAGQVGYYFEKDGNGFTAARLELYDDVAGITVPEVGDNDALALVYRLNKQGGKFVATTPKWLVVPKGALSDVLEQATREVTFDADGKMMVRNLKAQAAPSPKADPSEADNTASPQVPSFDFDRSNK